MREEVEHVREGKHGARSAKPAGVDNPCLHYAHLVPIAGDQVMEVTDCCARFKRNRQCPELTEEFRGGSAVGGGEQYGDIGPDQRPASLDEFTQPIQGCCLIRRTIMVRRADGVPRL